MCSRALDNIWEERTGIKKIEVVAASEEVGWSQGGVRSIRGFGGIKEFVMGYHTTYRTYSCSQNSNICIGVFTRLRGKFGQPTHSMKIVRVII